MKLKDGHTYITRIVRKRSENPDQFHPWVFNFECAPFDGQGSADTVTESGRFCGVDTKHKWDFVKEFKPNAK